MSHLSDLSLKASMQQNEYSKDILEHIEFCKFLILEHTDTDKEINPDTEYQRFLELINKRKG